VVENAIMFAEAARYLQQFALLNELASAAAFGGDTNEVAHRVIQRLRRTFRAGISNIYLRSADGRSYREYGGQPGTSSMPPVVEKLLVSPVLGNGIPVRLSWADLYVARPVGEETTPIGSVTKSALAVPLKYRGQVIGAIAVRSPDPEPFAFQDEQLLVLIAGHLAGLFENMRLSDETREWARNLGLIHQVVRRVVGMTDVGQISRIAAELMVTGFAYERAAVIMADEGLKAWVAGIGQPVDVLSFGQDQPGIGLSAQVMQAGVSRLANDVEIEPEYIQAEGWSTGSEMCVPLREGAHTFGALIVHSETINTFAENDLLSLEALSGVMSSVILSAQRYRQLQESFRQLQAVRESAIDLAADLDLDVLLHRVVHRARELVGARGAELGLLDKKEGGVRVLVSDTPWFDSRGQIIPLMAGVAGRVAAFGEPVVIDHYNTWNGRLSPDQTAPFKTVAGVPLKFRGEVIGTLTVIDDRDEWSFTAEHLQVLELLAPQATVWIRNARLYQELQERIEAQHRAELSLVRSARLAAVGEMAAGVAHELNNPLTSVNGFVELVLEELPADSPHRSDLELVMREAQRARGVVRRLLDFSRPVENQRVRTDLNELIADVLALVRHLARTGGIQIELNLEEGLPWVSVDPGHIKQVVLNLAHNAIQAMPHGGVLTISTEILQNESRWVVINVKDTGDGISPENLERIFEPFFTTRPAGSGTGLGLSVSYGIVNEHGGSIEVESAPGKGSCFTITLPLESDQYSG
jgi:signal transduction histidine kinase